MGGLHTDDGNKHGDGHGEVLSQRPAGRTGDMATSLRACSGEDTLQAI
jgi:hypothetical protein